MKTITQCLKIAASGIKSRRHLHLVRGTYNNLISRAKLSDNLQDSALRTFDRIANANGNFSKY